MLSIKNTCALLLPSGLFVAHKTPAVGAKFKKAVQLDPQSEPQPAPAFIDGKITFVFQSSE